MKSLACGCLAATAEHLCSRPCLLSRSASWSNQAQLDTDHQQCRPAITIFRFTTLSTKQCLYFDPMLATVQSASLPFISGSTYTTSSPTHPPRVDIGKVCEHLLSWLPLKDPLELTVSWFCAARSRCILTLTSDRHARRRPFASWMKRLANLKNIHGDSSQPVNASRIGGTAPIKMKKNSVSKNNPYPLSTRAESHNNGHLSFSTPLSSQRSRHSSLSQSKHSIPISQDGQNQQKSRAPTLATTAETTGSDGAPSGAGTSATAPRTEGDRNSTFSSPAPSLRSMTTTLTTVQSAAPALNNPPPINQTPSAPSTSASHHAPQPQPAIPAHLAPHSHPATYHSATANNVLTDDASIMTLASSSKRRRRNSVDTNASMKALAPGSMFGGSRESLPLSVLSGTVIHPGQADAYSLRDASGSMYANSKLNAERASLISASGVTAPALASERNSYIGSKYGDAASVRSGLLGGPHGRNDSISGSIGGREHRQPEPVTAPTSPLVEGETTKYTIGHAMPEKPRASRRSSDWAERTESRE